MRGHIRRLPILLTAWVVLACNAGAGEIFTRADGATVLRLVVHSWAFPDYRQTSTPARANIAVVKAFQKRWPEIFAQRYRDRYKADPGKYGRFNWDRVVIEPTRHSGIEVEGVENDLLAIAGQMAPEVIYVNFRKSDNYIQNAFLYPLDLPADGYLTSMGERELARRVHPKIWPVIRRKGPGGAKHVWALPHGGVLGKVLMYRKDLFDAADEPYPDETWTWDRLYTACKKIHDPDNGVYGIELTQMPNESWFWVTFLWSAGGEAMKYDERTDQWRCVFDSREAAVALDFYTKLISERWEGKDGIVHRGYAYRLKDNSNMWNQGKVAMRLGYINENVFATIVPEVTGMAPVPLGPTGKRAAELNGTMMGIFAGIEEPALRDAAWEFIRFYSSEESNRIRTRIMVEGGMGKFVNPRDLLKYGYPEVIRLAPKGWSRIFEIAVETGKPEPYGRNSNFAYKMMTAPIREARALTLAGKLPADREQRLDVLQDILRRANARANREMIGIITPQERRLRNIVAAVALLATIIAFALIFRRVFKTFTPPEAELTARRRALWGFRKYRWAYTLMLPAVLTIFLWRYIPLARGSIMAFQDYRLLGESSWVWLDGFGDLLFNEFWWDAVYNAVRYSFLIIALTFLPPIVLAILLQEIPRGRLLFRTVFYLPAVVTGLVTVLLWKQFYEPSSNGVLNAIVMKIPAGAFLGFGLVLMAVSWLFAVRLLQYGSRLAGVLFLGAGVLLLITGSGMAWPIFFPIGESFMQSLPHLPARLLDTAPEPFHWLEDPKTSMIACVIPMVWAGMGPGCLIYLAALKGIPDDFYEAASIDGAGLIDKILFVVFPILKPLILINFIGVFIGSWYGSTGRILAMTGGDGDTMVAGLWIFHEAFIYLRFGPATAAAWVLAFMLIGFTVHQLRILSRLEFRTTGEAK